MLRFLPDSETWRKSRLERLNNERGQGLAEYVVITIVIAVVLIVGIRYFGGSISEQLENATEEIEGLGGAKPSILPSGGEDRATSRTQASDEEPDPAYSAGEQGSTSSSSAKTSGDSSSGDGSDDEFESLKKSGVGISDEDGNQQIQVSEDMLWILGAIVVAFGVFAISRIMKEQRKLTKKSKRSKKSLRGKAKDESGQAMVEFAIVSITFLFTILGVIQLAMCLNAYALVRYAAYNAARAAIVHNGDVSKMEDAARLSLLAVFPTHGRADTALGMSQNYLAALATDSNPALTYYIEPITEVSIVDNMDVGSGEVITFDDPRDTDKAFITAQVIHRYELVIPLVNRIIFYIYTLWRENGTSAGVDLNEASAITDRLRRGGNFDDIEFRIPLVAHYTMRLQSDYEGP